jgi:hypothetical protein
VRAEDVGPAQQGIDERGLAVVYVGDERDGAKSSQRSAIVVIGIVVLVVERAVAGGDVGVLVVLSGIPVVIGFGGRAGLGKEEVGSGLLQLARFFEAAMASFFHLWTPGFTRIGTGNCIAADPEVRSPASRPDTGADADLHPG